MVVPIFKKGELGSVLQLSGYHNVQPCQESLFQGKGEGGLLDLRFRMSNADSILVMEQWIIQSTRVL